MTYFDWAANAGGTATRGSVHSHEAAEADIHSADIANLSVAISHALHVQKGLIIVEEEVVS